MVEMFKNNAVACIKSGNKFYDADKEGVVKIPFGDYGVHIRNRHKNKILVARIFIDGEPIHKSGSGFVFYEGEADTIFRSMFADKAFKLVAEESDEAIEFGKSGEDHLKQRGIVEIEFYEASKKPKPQPLVWPVWPTVIREEHHHYYPRRAPFYGPTLYGGGYANGTYTMNSSTPDATCRSIKNMSSSAPEMFAGAVSTDASIGEEVKTHGGYFADAQAACTVEGEATGQNFNTAYDIEVDWSKSTKMRMRLMGFNAPVVQEQIHIVPTRKTSGGVTSKDLSEALNEEAILDLALAKARIEAKKKELEKLTSNSA